MAALPHPMPKAVPAPSCCAGLRPALLNGWRDSFPLHPSPLHQIAAQCGSTWREVLQQCQRLQLSGSLQPLQARWGRPMQRAHQRLGLGVEEAQRPALLQALANEPACVRWDRVIDGPADQPTVWVDFVGRDLQTLQHSVQRTLRGVPMVCTPVSWTLLQAEQPCDCDELDGPCTDLPLAQAVEAGLPLVAQPYRHLAERVNRSERRVLARLQAWQRQGSLQGMVLAGPWSVRPQSGAMAWLQGPPPDASTLAQLRAHVGVVETQALWGDDGQPSAWCLGVRAPHDRAAATLRAALRAIGWATPPAHLVQTETTLPRPQPSLFH